MVGTRKWIVLGVAAVLSACTVPPADEGQRRPTPSARPGHATRAQADPERRAVPLPDGTGRVGSAENPRPYPCERAAEVAKPIRPDPRRDLVHGPFVYLLAREYADPRNPGRSALRHGGVKLPLYVAEGTTVTVTIAPEARGKVAINGPANGDHAVMYQACADTMSGRKFFAGGFEVREKRPVCVPLDIRIGREAYVERLTLALFRADCPVP